MHEFRSQPSHRALPRSCSAGITRAAADGPRRVSCQTDGARCEPDQRFDDCTCHQGQRQSKSWTAARLRQVTSPCPTHNRGESVAHEAPRVKQDPGRFSRGRPGEGARRPERGQQAGEGFAPITPGEGEGRYCPGRRQRPLGGLPVGGKAWRRVCPAKAAQVAWEGWRGLSGGPQSARGPCPWLLDKRGEGRL